MRRVKRRGFLKGVTLGAGATALGGTLRQLRAHAQGESGPKRIVIVMEGDCLNSKRFTPPETLVELDRIRQMKGLNGTAQPQWTHYVNDAPFSVEG
ncbi:MAG: twin-arginine translocation signal domain-containing protein, partial [Myxococcales bacterium]|nr:twin-arginine translocation signal domain-containing protein [Myxococcales bacterium]